LFFLLITKKTTTPHTEAFAELPAAGCARAARSDSECVIDSAGARGSVGPVTHFEGRLPRRKKGAFFFMFGFFYIYKYTDA
jgi:hypothetical protein